MKQNRILNIPSSEENFKAELGRIHSIAKLNGYDGGMVNKLGQKYQSKKRLKEITALMS